MGLYKMVVLLVDWS